MSPTCRSATPADAAALGDLHVRSWRETYDGLMPGDLLVQLSIESRVAMWQDLLVDPARHDCLDVVLIEEDDRIVGFGACGRQRDAALAAAGYGGEITAIYLLRSHQRRGAGRAVLAAMAQTLIAEGLHGAALWVLSRNAVARAFYEGLAGRVVGERTDAYDGVALTETAYGWLELSILTD